MELEHKFKFIPTTCCVEQKEAFMNEAFYKELVLHMNSTLNTELTSLQFSSNFPKARNNFSSMYSSPKNSTALS